MSNASDILEPNNPANATVEPKRNRKNRIPMSVPMRKLEVPEISGYHLHWIKESNIPRALQACYEFVDYDEVPVNQRGVGTDTEMSGNTDLGSRVSIDTRNAGIMGSIFRGEKILDKGEVSDDIRETRYVDQERTRVRPALFQRRRQKASLMDDLEYLFEQVNL